ncbi:hypothetical protein BU23DRAFT_598721 [Bimuria novae-zelandiae CBS 107.79]|uniref:Uncharacterized protein n=1 Tax=Bimuria novae-zelandiae CBS 107.79 TaxID=1447943 RepID=A0A6A5VCZ6_9PLEO|nr:hypothetical protein BU23DRAFT_598721 [Bimuria novae-zelandiae CBS 107.79]
MARSLTLAEFEALEHNVASSSNSKQAGIHDHGQSNFASKHTAAADYSSTQAWKSLTTLGTSLRQRLVKEGKRSDNPSMSQANPPSFPHGRDIAPAPPLKAREGRKIPDGTGLPGPAFEEPDESVQSPRLFASQNRTWIAIAGHPIDLKKVPGSEYVLLQIIARAGPEGISQPRLQKLSGQDKRSVPERTKQLQEKGYIDKRPIQESKARTSLCTHKMFLKDRPEEPQSVNDVFGFRTLNLTGLLFLLDKVLQATAVVQVRHLRTKMGVTVERWNGRAVRGALLRLEQTGYLERFTVEKKYKDLRSKTNLLICIRRLREPEEDDITNLRFKSIATGPSAADAIEEEPLEDDNSGDGFMRDLELDMMGEESDDDDELDTTGRIPPQWTPDRLLTNLVVDAVDTAGIDGIDTARLRDLTTGFFWKRPLESLVSRLTEEWYINQPLHARHLAIVRDTTMANDAKRVHYAYRTHRNFQKAVDAGEVSWEALKLDKGKKGKNVPPSATSVDSMGFRTLDPIDFHKRTGSSTLSEATTAIVRKARQARDWEAKLLKVDSERITPNAVNSSDSKKRPFVTQAQRIALNLPAKGRLRKDQEAQIRAHRKKTGDPNSIPEKLLTGVNEDQPEPEPEPKPKPKYERRPGPPLLTREERKARGLPEHGRLSFEVTKQILQEQGRKESLTHMKKFTATTDRQDVSDLVQGTLSGRTDEQSREHDTDTEGMNDQEDTMMLDNENQVDVLLCSHGPADDLAAKNPTTSQALDNSISDTVPRKKRAYGKRMSDPDHQAKWPRKKPKIGSIKSPEELLPDSFSPGMQTDGPMDAALTTGTVQGAKAGSIIGSPSSSEADQVGDVSSFAPPEYEISMGYEERESGFQHVEASRQGRENSYKKGENQIPRNSLPDGGMHVQAHKTQHDGNLEPGLYVDPNATRPAKGGRGRPKKMFLARFKLSALYEQDWFAPELIQARKSNSPSAASTTTIQVLAESGFSLKETNATGSVAPAVIDVTPESGSAESVQAPTDTANEETAALGTERSPSFSNISGATSMSHRALAQSCEPILQQINALERPFEHRDAAEARQRSASVHNVHTSVEQERTDGADSTHRSNQFFQATPRLPPAMNIATLPRDAPYQSLYHSTPSETPPITNDNPRSAKASNSAKPAGKFKDQSVRVGGGSVTHKRTEIVRHIFDLCGGVLPSMDIIYNVFPSVWNELGPKKIPCPTDGTIRDTVKNLSELSSTNMAIPRKDVPGKKLRTMWHFKRFNIASPEVQKVIGEMAQAFPEKYCPPGLRKYWRAEEKLPTMLPRLDNSYLEELYPPELEERIKEAKRERRRAMNAVQNERRRLERHVNEVAKTQAKEQKRQARLAVSGSRQQFFKKRQRLVGLSDGMQAGTAGVAPRSTFALTERNAAPSVAVTSHQQDQQGSPTSESSDEEPLINIRPRVQMAVAKHGNVTTSSQNSANALQSSVQVGPSSHIEALMAPTMRHHSPTHTFSTIFDVGKLDVEKPTDVEQPKKKVLELVTFEQAVDQVAHNKARLNNRKQPKNTENEFLTRHNIEICDDSDERGDEEEEEDGPTIAQRLAGLTGDQNEPDYEPRKRTKQPARSEPRDRRRKDRTRCNYNAIKEAKDRRLPETFDSLEEFKKLSYTLVIAHSMVGEDGIVDWDIVSQVYKEAPRFNLEKTKSMWAWMQKRMTEQLRCMTGSFQSHFLSAYEEGKVDPIDDPRTYDWAKLVRWALLTCTYLDPPLPPAREALNDCQFDISSYDVLDRKIWHNTNLANTNRDERLIKHSFGSPLHRMRNSTTLGNENDLKARSLVRATISTPKELYDKSVAHEKLREVPEDVINHTVDDFLRASLIRERKVKRQVPGRNYLFASQFAKHYRRTFQLSDFMSAVGLKKDLDAAFTSSDPEKRTYLVSRAADDGTVMALISLASEGRIKLVPRLPPIKNEFDAPLPRISVWGFHEGEYAHRLMDRKRLFWPIEAVPTTAYEYGNPLQPASSPPANDGAPHDWNPMPQPPLPTNEAHSKALPPIWSTIDGQTVIYPWWNRILNIVIQALLFSPGITSRDIFARCETYTTEVFEIQLVLDWLVGVPAAKKSPHGTYEVLPGYWAVFGDRLIDEETDEFGTHVRRQKKNMMAGKNWRTEVNRGYNARQNDGGAVESAQANLGPDDEASQQIFNDWRKQYSIAKEITAEPGGATPMEDVQSTAATEAQSEDNVSGEVGPGDQTMLEAPSTVPTPAFTPAATPALTPSTTTQDVEMMDADADGDVDAEGEWDDEYL